MKINGLTINLTYPIFMDQLPPLGFLTRDPACHALWFYYMLAMNAKSVVGKSTDDQIIEFDAVNNETPLWMDKRYNAQIKSIALLYGLESPDAMMKFWPNVKLEANRLGFPPPPSEIEHLTGHDRIT